MTLDYDCSTSSEKRTISTIYTSSSFLDEFGGYKVLVVIVCFQDNSARGRYFSHTVIMYWGPVNVMGLLV